MQRDASGTAETARRIVGIGAGPRVRVVELGNGAPGDQAFGHALAALTTFPEIEEVRLSGPGVTELPVDVLRRLPNLDSIMLWQTALSSDGLARLGPPLRVRELHLVAFNSPSGLVSGVASLKDLRVFSAVGVTLTSGDVEAIASRPKLENLRIEGARPAGEHAYDSLENAQTLTTLYARGVGFEDEDMATVAKLSRLEDLRLNKITDAGLARLEPLASLRRIILESPVTRSAAIEFSGTHPGCTVRHEEFLGGAYFRSGERVAERDLPASDLEAWGLR